MTSPAELAVRQRFWFRGRIALVWLALLFLVGLFFYQFDLDYGIMLDKLPYIAGFRLTKDGFIQGAALTLFLCVVSTAGALGLGLLAAVARLSSSAVAIGISGFYISFFRGTPLLVQILLIYLGLPQLGPVPDAIPCGIIALSLNYGAYMSEIFRAGIMSVPHGQREAALSLGLSRFLCFWKVILPQAMRVIIPPAGSQFIAMLKDSSLVSAMGVWEILFLSQSYARSSFRFIEMLLTAAVIYWILSMALEFGQARLERYYRRGFVR